MTDNKFLIKFCTRLQDVVDQLCKIFPKENDFAVLETAIAGCIEFNKYEYLAKEFYTYVYRYHTIIDSEDENALLNLDIKEDLKTAPINQKEASFKIEHFKKLLISGVSSQTKKNFFKHMKLLNTLIEYIRDKEKSVVFN